MDKIYDYITSDYMTTRYSILQKEIPKYRSKINKLKSRLNFD